MDVRPPVIDFGRLRYFLFGNPRGLGANAQPGFGRGRLPETLRGVSRPAGKPRAGARFLAENAGRAYSAHIGFRIDDGNCVPDKTRRARGCRQLFGDAGRRTSASGEQFLRGGNATNVRRRKRYLGWLESVTSEYPLSNG